MPNGSEIYNTTKSLMRFFSTPDSEMTVSEMMVFWTNLEDWEREYYRTVDLGTLT